MNWTFWRKWFPQKEIIIELDPKFFPRAKALNDLYNKDVTVLDYIWLVGFASREGRKPGEDIRASKSEVRRWCDVKNVWMNGKAVTWEEKVQWPVESCVLFPNGKRITFL